MSFRPPRPFLIPIALLAVLIGASAAMPIRAQQQERNGPTLVQPVDGTTVDRQFTVRVGVVGRGPADGTGIATDNRPDTRPPGGRAAPPANGPSDDTGLAPTSERRPRGPRFAVLIDAPAPAPGSPFQADAQHIAFPVGIPQMTLTLPPGQHQLNLLVLDREGGIAKRFPIAEPIKIIVK